MLESSIKNLKRNPEGGNNVKLSSIKSANLKGRFLSPARLAVLAAPLLLCSLKKAGASSAWTGLPFGEDFPANGLFIQSEISHPESMESIFTSGAALLLKPWMHW